MDSSLNRTPFEHNISDSSLASHRKQQDIMPVLRGGIFEGFSSHNHLEAFKEEEYLNCNRACGMRNSTHSFQCNCSYQSLDFTNDSLPGFSYVFLCAWCTLNVCREKQEELDNTTNINALLNTIRIGIIVFDCESFLSRFVFSVRLFNFEDVTSYIPTRSMPVL